jgi:flagellar basal-body rod protein FlgB
MFNLSETATIEIVRLALNAATMRHAVHAQTIANANAEGFVPARVSFEDQLGLVREQLLRGQPVGAANPLPEPMLEQGIAQVGQKIELDTEVAAMSKNALHYQALLKVLNKHLSFTATAIGGGRM